MSTAAWVFLVALLINLALLVVAVAGNADLAAENRRLRAKVRSLQPRDIHLELSGRTAVWRPEHNQPIGLTLTDRGWGWLDEDRETWRA